MITFTDECTRYKWTVPLYLRTEKQVRVAIISIIKQTRTLHNSNWFKRQWSAERPNRTLLDRCPYVARRNSPIQGILVYDFNHTYKQKLKCSPIEKAGIKPLKLKHIHAFGQLAYYRINSTSKLDIRAKLGYLLHPSAESYGYIILDAETNRLVDSTDFRPFYKNGPEGITEKEFYEQVGEWLHKAQDKLNSTSQEEKNEPEFITQSKHRKWANYSRRSHSRINTQTTTPIRYKTYIVLDNKHDLDYKARNTPSQGQCPVPMAPELGPLPISLFQVLRLCGRAV